MISKELFCKTIADIQTQDTRMNEFGDALNKICDTSVVFDVNNLYLTALLRILKEELNDRADIIQWWLYEDVRKCIWYDFQDGRRMRYDMPTAETLYDYLTIPFEKLNLVKEEDEKSDICGNQRKRYQESSSCKKEQTLARKSCKAVQGKIQK